MNYNTVVQPTHWTQSNPSYHQIPIPPSLPIKSFKFQKKNNPDLFSTNSTGRKITCLFVSVWLVHYKYQEILRTLMNHIIEVLEIRLKGRLDHRVLRQYVQKIRIYTICKTYFRLDICVKYAKSYGLIIVDKRESKCIDFSSYIQPLIVLDQADSLLVLLYVSTVWQLFYNKIF